MLTNNNTVLKIIAQHTEDPVCFEIESEKLIKSCTWSITAQDGNEVASGFSDVCKNAFEISAKFDALPWSLSAPNLYTLNITITDINGNAEKITDRFGFRYFGSDDKYLYLNGYPFYMRAYIRGAAAHEHQNNCRLEEYEFYKKNILAAKSYGFNTIRFHSTIPPEACFRAADDLGILIHIEMRRGGKKYDNLREMLYGKNDFVENEELDNIINTLYNHPSFMVYCVGNEIRQPATKPRIREIRDYIKKKDPTRLFIDTCAHGEYDRDYVDFDVQHMGYFFPYGRNANMFDDTDNLLCFGTVRDIDMVKQCDGAKIRRALAFDRPLIAHEICHYTSWRDYYALKEKFEKYGIEVPWWVDESIKMLEAKGYTENFHEMLQITKDFQFRLWKTALENLRAGKLLSGFHMLQFADTDKYENSNGVVDCFDDPHGISPEAFKAFNGDTVLLARQENPIYTAGTVAKIPVLLSQYAINPPESADFTYRLSADDGLVSEGGLNTVNTGCSGLYSICKLEIDLPHTDSPKKLTLCCELKFDDGSLCSNSWEMWLFPAYEHPLALEAKCDMQEKYLENACVFDKNSNLTVTDKLDDTLFEKLERGENVILIYRTDWTRHLLHKQMPAPKYSFKHTWDRFKGVIWDRGTQNGGPDNKDILNSHGFVTDGQINYQYYNLIDDSDKLNLDDFPINPVSIVSGLDKSSRDRFDPKKFGERELMYDRTMRRFSYAFAMRVGKGKLLVTGFNFTHINEDPATYAMLRALISYASTDSYSKAEQISVDDLRKYLLDTAAAGPQKERMMTQYWQLDDEPVESMEYWEESERYLRE